MTDDVIAANIKQIGSAQKHVSDHQHGKAVPAFLVDFSKNFQYLIFTLQQRLGIITGDLTDAEFLLCKMEFLEIPGDQLLQVRMGTVGVGEKRPSKFFDRHTADPRHSFCQGNIPFGAGRGFEHHGIGKDRTGHQSCHFGGRKYAMLNVHVSNDGVGAANRFIAHADGLQGLDIRETVVVDDFEDFCFIQSRNSLRNFVVVHQNHFFALWTHQMVTGKHPDHFVILIQNRIIGIPAVSDLFAYIVDIIIQMEGDQIIGDAVVGNRNCLD